MDPGTAALIASAISASGSIAGGILGNPGNQETKMERTKRKLVDRLVASLSGGGDFAGLYANDEDTFNKSFREPAMANFRNRTAPEIQQQFVASGQQRSSGLDDQLLRAGVDLDQLLNSHMMDYQQRGLDRKQNTIGAIMGVGPGASNPMSTGQAAAQGLGGYLTSDAFTNQVQQGFKPYTNPQSPVPEPTRNGFVPDKKSSLPEFRYS